VAFGMGIDRSNVRLVVHAAMPKTVEHYQQETGRAGRDGLEAECVLLYSGRDVPRWEHLIGMSAESAEDPEAVIEAQTALLRHMQGYCRGLECRHRTLSRYFGQQYPHESCGACDVCLGEVQGLPDSTTVARKILSGVGRFERPFGVKYLVEVLRGANTATVRERRHDQLSTHSLMRDADEKTLVQLVYQLVDQGLLARSTGEYPTVSLTDDALPVLRGEREVRLSDPGGTKVRRTAVDEASWEGVDRGLFDHLRELRRELATEQAIPPYMIFDDNTLRELAQVRPGSLDTLVHVRGIGRKKLEQFGQRFVDAIVAYCQGNGLETDAAVGSRPSRTVERERRPNPVREQAMKLFADGRTVHEVAEAIGRARSTTAGYLSEYVEQHRPESIDPWVDADAAERVRAAAREHGHAMLRPIYEALDGAIDYETIRLTLAHARARDA
ncbi:MAG: RQC domain-containing protein, partial [Phycisphaeraceae bacterium]